MVTKEELIAKAQKPGKDAMRLHPFYKGKIEIVPKCCVRDFNDFAIWYTPGVAQPCKDIDKYHQKVWEHTNKANTVAVISDGTRVLGLGDIGPEAGLPVMEGKALLFKYLGGVDVYPLCLDTKDPDELIRTVKILQPSFGGINLEDIAQPKCFHILDTLRHEARIPVWHDDQQGTATVTVAALLNALKIVGKKIHQIKVSMIGAGAASVACLRVMIAAGVDPANVIMCDINGILHPERTEYKRGDPRYVFCRITNKEGRRGKIPETMRDTDVCIGYSAPGPDIIKKEWVASMKKDAVIFACANPIPEIWPWDAKEAGARIVATGRSDFPNQVNNSLGFPAIFRGTLDVRAKTITDEMCIAAAYELAQTAVDKGLNEDYLIPTMDEWEVYPREATAVALKAMEQGIARIRASKEELFEQASRTIKRARDQAKVLMESGIIPEPPEED
ncbi:MAG: malate dehydrogenase [candidate division Zixibacteria bacterium SM1_73]|nr:MAG: malate dehydrogenase [candidate division Zixibacteria bacterium SM1_73]